MTLEQIFALHPWMNSSIGPQYHRNDPRFAEWEAQARRGYSTLATTEGAENGAPPWKYDEQGRAYIERPVSTPDGIQATQRFDPFTGNPIGPVMSKTYGPSGTLATVEVKPWAPGQGGLSANTSDFLTGSDIATIGAMAAAAFGASFLPTTAGAAGVAPEAGALWSGLDASTLAGAGLAEAGAGAGGLTAAEAAAGTVAGSGVNAAPAVASGVAKAGGAAAAGSGLGASIDRIWNGGGTPGDFASLGIGVGVPLLGSLIQGNAVGRAADTQAAATIGAIGEQRRQFDLTRADTAPYREQGQKAVGELGTRTLAGGNLVRPFTLEDFWKDPVTQASYQAGLDEGKKALQNMAPLTTGRDSGAAVKELTKFATDWTGRSAAGSHDRFVSDQGNWYNRLAALAGIGQTGVAQATGAGTASAGNIANMITAGGDARGASQIAQGNAVSNALSGIANWWQGQDVLDKLLRSRGGYAYA